VAATERVGHDDGVAVRSVRTRERLESAGRVFVAYELTRSVIRESSVTTTPSGLRRTVTVSRAATLADPANPLSATRLTETVTVNGRPSVSTYDAAARTVTAQSPAGRTRVALLDAQGRIVEVRPPGYSTGAVWPVRFSYDAGSPDRE